MNQRLAHVAIVVKDYDEAIDFYSKKLGFKLIEDTKLTEDKRWVLLSPIGDNSCSILLAKAANDRQNSSIGNQTGGRVFLFLYTDDFWTDYNQMIQNQIRFIRQPKDEEYGIVAVFEDLYGNLWDLIQPKQDKSKQPN